MTSYYLLFTHPIKFSLQYFHMKKNAKKNIKFITYLLFTHPIKFSSQYFHMKKNAKMNIKFVIYLLFTHPIKISLINDARKFTKLSEACIFLSTIDSLRSVTFHNQNYYSFKGRTLSRKERPELTFLRVGHKHGHRCYQSTT